jgi:hypothetical protein
MEWYHRIPYVPYIYKPRENINGTVHNAVEGGKGGGGKDDESLQGRRADTGRYRVDAGPNTARKRARDTMAPLNNKTQASTYPLIPHREFPTVVTD